MSFCSHVDHSKIFFLKLQILYSPFNTLMAAGLFTIHKDLRCIRVYTCVQCGHSETSITFRSGLANRNLFI